MVQTIGETRQAMRETLLSKKLQDIATQAHEERKLDEFWIVITHKLDEVIIGVIREAVVVTNKRPPKMLSSMCFHVVYSKGLIEPEWILPRDMPIIEELVGSSGLSSVVNQSAMGVPILNA